MLTRKDEQIISRAWLQAVSGLIWCAGRHFDRADMGYSLLEDKLSPEYENTFHFALIESLLWVDKSRVRPI